MSVTVGKVVFNVPKVENRDPIPRPDGGKTVAQVLMDRVTELEKQVKELKELIAKGQ